MNIVYWKRENSSDREMSYPEISRGMIGVLLFGPSWNKALRKRESLTGIFRKYRNLPSETYFSKIGHARNLSLPSQKAK